MADRKATNENSSKYLPLWSAAEECYKTAGERRCLFNESQVVTLRQRGDTKLCCLSRFEFENQATELGADILNRISIIDWPDIPRQCEWMRAWASKWKRWRSEYTSFSPDAYKTRYSSFMMLMISWEVCTVQEKPNLTHVLVDSMSENKPQPSKNRYTTPFFIPLSRLDFTSAIV